MAHLKAIETTKNSRARKEWKYQLIRHLYQRKYEKVRIFNLLRFIHWVMQLPVELEEALVNEIQILEEKQKMPYTSNYEEVCKKMRREEGREEGKEKGREEGREIGIVIATQEHIIKTLHLRFGQVSFDISESISQIQDRTVLDSMLEQAIKANSIDEFKKSCGFV